LPSGDRSACRICARLAPILALVPILLASPGAARAASAPTVSITSPTAAQTVEGTVRVEATAAAATGEYPTRIDFYDGVNEIGEAECQKQQTCSGSVEWKATGLSGAHTLTARTETNTQQEGTSGAVTVTVDSPLPTVRITSPASGATVKGTVDITASAATDPSQEDYPTNITFYDGVNRIGDVECQGQRTCEGEVEWHATGLSGAHTLTARVDTHRELAVTSGPVTVTVVSPSPSVKITHPGDGAPLRGTIEVEVYGATDPSQVDYPTGIDVYDGTDEIGDVTCQGQRTCAGGVQWSTAGLKGVQVLRATVHTNTDREATSAPVYVGGAPRRHYAPMSCHIDSHHVRVRHQDNGSCVIYDVPKGTAVVVQYRTAGAGWRSIGKSLVALPASGRYKFEVRNRVPVTFQVGVLVSANRRYAATRVLLGTVRITR
jgi:Bacterial Ig domain